MYKVDLKDIVSETVIINIECNIHNTHLGIEHILICGNLSIGWEDKPSYLFLMFFISTNHTLKWIFSSEDKVS